MVTFHSYVTVYQMVYPINIPLNHYKVPWNHDFQRGRSPTTTNHQPGTGAGHQPTRGDPDPKAALPTTLLSPSAATPSGGGDNGGGPRGYPGPGEATRYLGDVTTNAGKTRSYSSHDMTGNCRNSTSNNGIVLPTKNKWGFVNGWGISLV